VPGLLGGDRIVDLTATISGQLAMILADQGADVSGVTGSAPLPAP
jgi:hypothetical protein